MNIIFLNIKNGIVNETAKSNDTLDNAVPASKIRL